MSQLRRLSVCLLPVGLLLMLPAWISPVLAQQAPLTGQMLGGQDAPPLAVTALPAALPAAAPVPPDPADVARAPGRSPNSPARPARPSPAGR